MPRRQHPASPDCRQGGLVSGEEPVRKYRGVPPYAETRGYVKRVMSLLGLSYDGLGAKTRVYMYRQPNGRILLTDRVMPTNRGYRSLK